MHGGPIDGGELARLRREVVEVSAENAALRSRLAQAADAERRLTLAVRELGHRLKNTLATVQAIVNLTARSVQTIDDFRVAVTKRIAALAKNHALLIANDWTGASLEQVLRAELAPFDDGTGQRIQLVPRHRGFDGFGMAEDGQVFGGEEHLDAARQPWLAADQAEALQREHHLVHGGRTDPEMALHVGLGRGTAMDAGVGVNEDPMGAIGSLLLSGRVRVLNHPRGSDHASPLPSTSRTHGYPH